MARASTSQLGDRRVHLGEQIKPYMLDMLDYNNYSFNVYAIPLFITTAVILSLSLLVIIREQYSKVGVLFLLVALTISVWLFSFSWMYSATHAGVALWWAKLGYLGIPLIPAAVYHFSIMVLQGYPRRRRLVWLIWMLALVFSASALISDDFIRGLFLYGWGYYPNYGWLSVPFFIFYAGVTAALLYEYIKIYRDTIPSKSRRRIKLLMIAFGVLYLASFDFLAKFGIPLYPFGYLPTFAFIVIITYTLIRYRLVDLSPAFAAGQILETLQGAVLVTDLDGKIRVANQAACAMLGYTESGLIDMPLDSIFESPLEALEPKRLLNSTPVHDQVMVWRTKSGTRVDVCVSVSVVPDRDNKPAGSVYIALDISERLHAEQVRKREERYALAISGARDGLWDWNLKTNEIYFSPRWKFMLDYQDNEIGNSPDEWFNLIHPEDAQRVQGEINAHLEGQTPHFESEYRMMQKDGTYLWMLSRGSVVHDDQGDALRIVGSQSDVTERKSSSEQLSRQASHDSVTNLLNRASFTKLLRRTIERTRQVPNSLFALLFLDLDRFKVINDSAGHLIGDQFLIAVARKLELCLRPRDTLARFGGDEFIILLDNISHVSDATCVADRIHKELHEPTVIQGQTLSTSASIGIALSTTGYERAEDILRDADAAMYRAKAQGKARTEVFDTGIRAHTVGQLELETDLRSALEHGEFRIHYQPIVSLGDNKITGAEALIRWHRPRHGLLYPAEFIASAEETGLIRPMGEWLLRTACAQNKAWNDAGYPLRLGVNFSIRQFQEHNLTEHIKQMLKETGLSAQSLMLEITESLVMENLEFGVITLYGLSALGIYISIDDFGIGHSSLVHLKRLSAHTLKIDMSYVHGVSSHPDHRTIIKAIIALAHSLNLKVVAKGVETEEQLAFLYAEHCDEVQGNLFSSPVPAETLTQLLVEHKGFIGRRRGQFGGLLASGSG